MLLTGNEFYSTPPLNNVFSTHNAMLFTGVFFPCFLHTKHSLSLSSSLSIYIERERQRKHSLSLILCLSLPLSLSLSIYRERQISFDPQLFPLRLKTWAVGFLMVWTWTKGRAWKKKIGKAYKKKQKTTSFLMVWTWAKAGPSLGLSSGSGPGNWRRRMCVLGFRV